MIPIRDQLPEEAEWTSMAGLGGLLGLAWVLVAFSAARAFQSGATGYGEVLNLLIPTVFGLTLFAGGVGILVYGLLDQADRIAQWTGLGSIGVFAAVALNTVLIPAGGFDFGVVFYTLVNGAIGGAVLGFLVGLYDAHQNRLQADLEAEHEHSTQLSQRLSVINRVMRHDMRHQTQLIRGHAQRLLDGTDDIQTAATRIANANERLLDLAEEARQLQELLSGERYGPEELDIVEICERAVDRVQKRHPELGVDRDLGHSQSIRGSPLVEDVLGELLDNAVHHNHDGDPRVSIELSTDPANDRPITLRIRDNGPGIPESEPLRQATATESPLEHSNGFGLWFATWVIEETDGEIEIETPDETGIGTEITMRFHRPEDALKA